MPQSKSDTRFRFRALILELPEHWVKKTQRVSGTPTKEPGPKEQKVSTEDRLVVMGVLACLQKLREV